LNRAVLRSDTDDARVNLAELTAGLLFFYLPKLDAKDVPRQAPLVWIG
jgi:hypothetical protein